MTLPADKEARKSLPIMTGLLDYFPDAAAMIAYVSKVGNDQHNPGQPLHWSRGKSMDHADALLRHLMERGKIDIDGLPHSAKAAWRALALLQEELEAHGADLARGARYDEAPDGGLADDPGFGNWLPERMLPEDLPTPGAEGPGPTFGALSGASMAGPHTAPARSEAFYLHDDDARYLRRR